MPYFVYRIERRPIKVLRKLDSFGSFNDASRCAKEERARLADNSAIKVIFAENELQAEELLSTEREQKIFDEE